MGRDRDGAAGDALGTDDGEQCDQYSGCRQYGGVQLRTRRAKRVAQYALQLFNNEIERELGVANVLTTMLEPSIEAAEEIFQHPGIALLCVTGGPAVVKAAGKYGKRVIAAGPGNPPVVVDETADLRPAAKSIIKGAAFDNNLLCIGEKEVFVVASVFEPFMTRDAQGGRLRDG